MIALLLVAILGFSAIALALAFWRVTLLTILVIAAIGSWADDHYRKLTIAENAAAAVEDAKLQARTALFCAQPVTDKFNILERELRGCPEAVARR